MLVLKPLYEQTQQSGLAKATLLAYPVVDVVVAVTALSVAAHARHDTRRLLRLVACGFVLIAVADSGATVDVAMGVVGFSWTNFVLQAGLVCLFLAALLPASSPHVRSARREISVDAALPFVPVVVTTGVGLHYIFRGNVFGAVEALIATAMIVGLLGRQLLYTVHVGAIARRMSAEATQDSLTGLANRRSFVNTLDTSLTSFPAGGIAVVLVDLDGFKEVNDTFGHAAGDAALVHFAERLSAAASSRAMAARLGGDEFAVLIVREDAEIDALTIADEVTKTRRAHIGSVNVAVGASAGIAVNVAGETASQLLRRADLAMYEAKRSAQSATAIFTNDMAGRSERRKRLMQELPGAAERGEFRLVYQPLYSLSDRSIAGAEALLRWHHPLHGNVPPDEFIRLAEEAGIISEMGKWVLETAVRQVHQWRVAGKTLPHLFLNVSAQQFTGSFAATTLSTIKAHSVQPAAITLEITESALPHLSANRALQDLRASGMRIAMDDFGAGFSSLAQLARLPVDTLKIDREFVRGINTPNGRRIVTAMITLAVDMGLRTVAEGIEKAADAEVMHQAGCDLAQGYHFAKPLPATELAYLLPNVEPPLDDLARPPTRHRETAGSSDRTP